MPPRGTPKNLQKFTGRKGIDNDLHFVTQERCSCGGDRTRNNNKREKEEGYTGIEREDHQRKAL